MIKTTRIIKKVSSLKTYLLPEDKSHVWQFSKVGGVNRVNIETGMDIVSLEHLDQKLWTALSCPVHGLEIDSKTLELIDTDHDNRIRVPEILEAVKWITSVIKNSDVLIKPEKAFPLSVINESTEDGRKLFLSAKQILKNIGKPDSDEITVEETTDTVRIFSNTKFNGDGLITEESTDDIDLKKLIGEIISCIGSGTDRSGKPGISSGHVQEFYENCEDYSGWYAKAEADLQKTLPFGDNTEKALNSLNRIKSKIEDYFVRCKLAEFDPESVNVLNSLNERLDLIRTKDLTIGMDEIAGLPIAKIEAGKPLQLTNGINPAWVGPFNDFKALVIDHVFSGITSITEKDWEKTGNLFSNYCKWQSEKIGNNVEKLGLLYIRKLLSGNEKEALLSLIEKDKELENEAGNIFLVDKLVRYYRDIYTLLKNFVTFSDFYSSDKVAVFQAGSLYLDQRCCDLCIKVSDMSKHNLLAGSSGICLVYCDCFSKTLNAKMTIVAALTDGDIDNISVGRNAVFYDRKGNDWDATIVKIIDNPISIRQAFWSPYKKVSKFISTQIEKIASDKEKEVHATATTGIEKHSEKVDKGLTESLKNLPAADPVPVTPTVPAAPSPPFDIGKFVGIFAAFSLALGAIGSVVVSVLTGFFGLEWWKMPLAILGIILTISGPSMVLAWLKLRKRNLAPLLDANGWAINARTSINIQFGNTLTHLASLPVNSKLNLIDPFSKKRKPIIPVLIILIIILSVTVYILWHYGYIVKWGIL